MFQDGALYYHSIVLIGINQLNMYKFELNNTPTALVFIPIIRLLIEGFGFPSIPLYYALIIAVNLGGYLIPQGAACDVMTLKIAQNNAVENLNFKRLLKVGAIFVIIHIALSIGYFFCYLFFWTKFGINLPLETSMKKFDFQIIKDLFNSFFKGRYLSKSFYYWG